MSVIDMRDDYDDEDSAAFCFVFPAFHSSALTGFPTERLLPLEPEGAERHWSRAM